MKYRIVQVLQVDDGKPIALAGKRKPQRMRNPAAIHGALGDLMQE